MFIDSGSEISGVPVAVFGDYVQNIASGVDDYDQGWLAGFSVGKCKEPFSVAFSYNYRYLEKDAVVGAFTDSDFGGGGTDAKGHQFGLNFQAARNVQTGITCLLDKKGMADGKEEKDYNCVQVDVNFKF